MARATGLGAVLVEGGFENGIVAIPGVRELSWGPRVCVKPVGFQACVSHKSERVPTCTRRETPYTLE